jgi:hypothetical protein
MFSFISNLFKNKPSKPPVITPEDLDNNRVYGPPYGYLIDQNFELWRGRSHPDDNMHWSKLTGMHNNGSPCWVLSRSYAPTPHELFAGIGLIVVDEDCSEYKSLVGLFGRRAENTYPNPLNVGLGFGRIKLSLFHAGGSHGVLIEEMKDAHKVGELFYDDREDVDPRPGHIYLTCHSVESAIALRDMVSRVVHSFPVTERKPGQQSVASDGSDEQFEPYWFCADHLGDPLGCVELLASASQDLMADPVFTHFAAEVAQGIAGEGFDIVAGLCGARIVYSQNSHIPKDVVHKMADAIVAHKTWIGLCAAVSVLGDNE